MFRALWKRIKNLASPPKNKGGGQEDISQGMAEKMKKMIKLMVKALKTLLKLSLSFLFPFFLLLFVGFIGYYVITEQEGAENTYYEHKQDDYEYDEEQGAYKVTEENMVDENRAVKDFYHFFSAQSINQLDEGLLKSQGKYKFYKLDDSKYKKDYYNRDKKLRLNEKLLYQLDEIMFSDVRYPEMFMKPVNFEYSFDDDGIGSLKTVPLTRQEEGVILSAKSPKLDQKTGKPIKKGSNLKNPEVLDGVLGIDYQLEDTELEYSVSHYGLGPVVLMDELDIYETLEGNWIEEEVYDEETGEVKWVDIEPEKFSHELKREKKPFIRSIATAVGNELYLYEEQRMLKYEVPQGVMGKKSKDLATLLPYKTIEVPVDPEDEENEETKEITLHRKRTAHLYETLPIVVETKKDDLKGEYIKDFIDYFDAYIPADLFNDLSFVERIDYESEAFGGGDYSAESLGGLELGSHVDTSTFKNAHSELWNACKKAGETVGVDPYILLAIATQESAGKPIANGGYFQITENYPVREVETTDANGNPISLTINVADRYDKEKSALFTAMDFKQKLELWDGNVAKVLQSKNFGEAGLRDIKKIAGSSWDTPTGWMIYREEARIKRRPNSKSASYHCMDFPGAENNKNYSFTYGDSCYVENVLRYYAGDSEDLAEIMSSASQNSFLEALKDAFKEMFEKFEELFKGTKLGKEEVPVRYLRKWGNEQDFERIMYGTIALNKNIIYSLAEKEEIDWWDDIFHQSEMIRESLEDGYLNYDLSDFDERFKFGEMANSEGYIPPLKYNGAKPNITSGFGPRNTGIAGASTWHKGIDLGYPTGTPVYAVRDGRVETKPNNGGAGNSLTLHCDNGDTAKYFHLSGYKVRSGEVKQGDLIAYVGNTGVGSGAHLHFEVIQNGKHKNPLPIVAGLRPLGGINLTEDIEKIDISDLIGNTKISKEREAIVKTALSGVKARIPYWYGGKASRPGFDGNNFGSTTSPDHKGRTKKGLDCSGFVNWVFWTAFGDKSMQLGGGGTANMGPYMVKISKSELKPGDIGLRHPPGAGSNHVAIYGGNGKWIHTNGAKSTGYAPTVGSSSLNHFYRHKKIK